MGDSKKAVNNGLLGDRNKLKEKDSLSDTRKKKQLSKKERDAVVKRVGRLLEELTDGGVELSKLSEDIAEERLSKESKRLGNRHKRSSSASGRVNAAESPRDRDDDDGEDDGGESGFVFHKELRCADCYGLIVDSDTQIEGSPRCSPNCVRNTRGEPGGEPKRKGPSSKSSSKRRLEKIAELESETEDATSSKLKADDSVTVDTTDEIQMKEKNQVKSNVWPVVAKEMSEMFEKQSGQIQSYMSSVMSLFKDFLNEMSRNMASHSSLSAHDLREKYSCLDKIYQTKPSPSTNIFDWDISCMHHLPVHGAQLSKYDYSYLTRLGDYMNCELSLQPSRSHVFLPTAMILIRTGEGTNQLARALLSSSSKGNFISKTASDKFRLIIGPDETLIRTTIGSRFTPFTSHVDLRLQEITQDRTCCALPDLNMPLYVELADPVFLLPYDVDLVIGLGVGGSVDVVLDSPEGGYFLKQSIARATPADPPPPAGDPPGAVLTTERFAVFQTSRPLAVRASYGPFSTKQTVPARSLVAEPSSNTSEVGWGRHLDLSAHLVTKNVERDWPVVRVVMHTGAEPGAQRVCAVVHASMGDSRVSGACSPDTHEGMCLVELLLPWSWWPPLPSRRAKPTKTPPRLVSLAYTVVEPLRGPQCTPKVMIQSLTPLGNVQLVSAIQGYNTISTDNHVTMLMPQRPLYPTSKTHIPTYVTIKRPSHITGFMIRARVKSGLKILGAELISREEWNMTVEINTKQSVGTVTVINKQQQQDVVPRTEDVFVWIVEVAGGSVRDLWQEGKLVWSVRYLNERGHPSQPMSHHHGKHKASVRIHINKDDIHALIPISKNWEVVNSAILTGKQVSQGMKVVMVSHGGHLADVTLQASCHVPDDSVIKVSSSCSSVYVDGSEVRGSANASVVVSYGNLVALASFIVWMPELPVEVSLPDTRLSQVKGWRVPDLRSNKLRRSVEDGLSILTEDNSVDKTTPCRLRYQQTDVEVYARFVAADHDSGRVSYLVNRRTWLRVTQLVLGLLRVSDTRIASLSGNVLQGRAPGRTELQVVSAVSGRVLGAKEVRVLSDKVTITKLSASVVSGLQLAISPDTGVDNGYIAQASVTRRLTAQYQEGLLDMELVFSDGSTTSVSSIEREDYQLTVETERPDVVAFAPQTPMSQPRVIAVSQGHGNLLSVTMHPPLMCGSKVPLASTHSHVEIDFNSGLSVNKPELVQNDGGANREISADLHDILIGKESKRHRDPMLATSFEARQHNGGGGGGGIGLIGLSSGDPSVVSASRHHYLSPLEIGMYVLLAAFCFAIVIFVVSCVVYASKFKAESAGPGIPGGGLGQEIQPGMHHHHHHHPNGGGGGRPPTTQNVHDWVWLGRSTLHVTDNPMFQAGFHGGNHSPHPHHHWDENVERLMNERSQDMVPPVPPHGPGALEDYRPPVPPHRQPINSNNDFAPPPSPHHQVKHHHHHKIRGRKRTTVQGNPLFNDNDTGLALEELNLGMDYNKIMQYFDNLKESNA